MTAGWYETGRRDKNLQAAVGPFCTKVLHKIKELTLGVDFVLPENNAELQIGWQTFTCRCTARPGSDIFLFTQRGDRWWSRRERLEQTTDNLYRVETHFDTPGHETIHVIKATDIGMIWIKNYRRMVEAIRQYPPIIEGELPRAFVPLASIMVDLLCNTM